MDRKSKYMRLLSWLLIFSLLNATSGCNYYTFTADTAPAIEKLDKLKNSPNFIIIHHADQAFNFRSVKVDQQAQTISGQLTELGPESSMYKSTKSQPGTANRYKKKGPGATPYVINEVHFYVRDIALKEGESITLPLSSIEKVEVYDPDTGATTASHIFGAIGVIAGLLLVISIIILLTKSSCPFVYVNNGSEYVFAGEIYSGAIFKGIERDDYLLLPHIEAEDNVEVIIANKLKEKQYINQLGIIQVGHPTGTQVFPDKQGAVHLVRHPLPMIGASVNDQDITSLLLKLDSTHFTFNEQSGDYFFNEVMITLPKPTPAREGHLIMNTKNSLWGDYVFGEFTKLFGSSYSSWLENQNKKPEYESGKWAVDQGLAMKVFIETNGEWMLSDTIDLVGPLAFRDLVVPLNLTHHTGDTVRIKLSAGFMMWDLDYVGIDYSHDDQMNINYIKPSVATTEENENALVSILNADHDYLAQEKTGDEVTITFPIAPVKSADIKYDYVLHARGYYQHVRDYKGSPEITTLLSFKREGRFSQFSKEKLDEMNQLLQLAEISASIK